MCVYVCKPTKEYIHKIVQENQRNPEYFNCRKMNSIRIGVQRLLPVLRCNSIAFTQRWSSTASIIQYRNELFTMEKKRQREAVGRIEKIQVRFLGVPEDTTLVMNRGLSTPYDCAQHLSDRHCEQSVVAVVDSHTPWDMHRPLEDDCTLQLQNFTVADPHLANRTFWRSCSFMLGAVLSECFKDAIKVQLHSFPSPNIKSGSFIYDIALDRPNWEPKRIELQALSGAMINLAQQNWRFEWLEVSKELALEMFADSPFKREQLPDISRSGSIGLYRIGSHIDISRGPMMNSTNLLGKVTIGAVHKIADIDNENSFYRVQGVALPTGVQINHFAFSILEDRAKKLNPARLPTEPFEDHSMEKGIA